MRNWIRVTKYIFWNFFSITHRLINHNNFVVVLSFVSLAIFCFATEHFSNAWYVYFWIWQFFPFSLKWRTFFVFVMVNHAKWLPRKNQGFFICRFRVIIIYQLFESIQNHVVFFRCWHFYINFAHYFQTFLNQRWTTKILRCECCSYLCTSI